MNIIVTVKHVPDPEAPPGAFRVTLDGDVSIGPTVSRVLSPYDESALEAGLQLRDAHGGKVSLVCVGVESDEDFLRDTMATGADEAYLVADRLFEGGDSFATAYAISKAVARIGEFDLILCGRQASDTDAGVVGGVVAEWLGLPCASVVRKVELVGDKVKAERVIEDGIEVMELSLPALLTTTSELYTLRYASIPDIMAAAERPVMIWDAEDIGAIVDELKLNANRSAVQQHFIPLSTKTCEFVGGERLDEAAACLATALRGRKVI